ncbi:MAG: hypothetical protein LIO42_03190 [Oscillospiraceae bacterium]|nr:hypothetical protein [Oscillospiraceae bacterium]
MARRDRWEKTAGDSAGQGWADARGDGHQIQTCRVKSHPSVAEEVQALPFSVPYFQAPFNDIGRCETAAYVTCDKNQLDLAAVVLAVFILNLIVLLVLALLVLLIFALVVLVFVLGLILVLILHLKLTSFLPIV